MSLRYLTAGDMTLKMSVVNLYSAYRKASNVLLWLLVIHCRH